MKTVALMAALLVSPAAISAPSLTKDSAPRPASNPASQAGALPTCGSTVLMQSVSQTITALNSVSCNNGAGHTSSSYYRAFASATIPNGFSACQVIVGIESATSGSGSQPVTVNLYSNSGSAFPSGTLTLVGTTSTTVADQSQTMIAVPVTGVVDTGNDLIVEFNTPDGQAAGNLLFIGSNSAGQTDNSYLKAADCGVTSPATTAALGFPGMHIVLNVEGTPSAILTYAIGGAVSGLGSGNSVVLQNNSGDDLTVSANGVFTFATAVNSGTAYAVTVKTQPTGQICTVSNGTGTATGDVSDVSITCSLAASLRSVPTLSECADHAQRPDRTECVRNNAQPPLVMPTRRWGSEWGAPLRSIRDRAAA